MAITKTESISRIEIIMEQTPRLNVLYDVLIDDPDDDLLPVRTNRSIEIQKRKPVVDADGNQTEVIANPDEYDQVIQDILNILWVDDEAV